MDTERTGTESVIVERPQPGVAQLTLNRPEKRNAVNAAMRRGLMKAFEATADCRVVILTGAGESFCAGIDLKEAAQLQEDGATPDQDDHDWASVQLAIRDHPAVFIAAVGGSAMGGGMTLVNSADLSVAADDAVFGMPEISFGLYPSMAGPSTQLRISPKHAAWMVLTGSRIDGRTAAEWGLVNFSVPADRVMDEAFLVAERIAGYDPVGLRHSKRALWTIPSEISEWGEALRHGEEVGSQIRQESDALRSGLADFVAGGRSSAQGGGRGRDRSGTVERGGSP